jgi:hypothetical protein
MLSRSLTIILFHLAQLASHLAGSARTSPVLTGPETSSEISCNGSPSGGSYVQLRLLAVLAVLTIQCAIISSLFDECWHKKIRCFAFVCGFNVVFLWGWNFFPPHQNHRIDKNYNISDRPRKFKYFLRQVIEQPILFRLTEKNFYLSKLWWRCYVLLMSRQVPAVAPYVLLPV